METRITTATAIGFGLGHDSCIVDATAQCLNPNITTGFNLANAEITIIHSHREIAIHLRIELLRIGGVGELR